MGGEIGALTGGGNPLSALTGGGNPMAALGQMLEKCGNCLKCLKDKLCSCCASGMKDGDDKVSAAEGFAEGAWQEALKFLQGQGTAPAMAMGT